MIKLFDKPVYLRGIIDVDPDCIYGYQDESIHITILPNKQLAYGQKFGTINYYEEGYLLFKHEDSGEEEQIYWEDIGETVIPCTDPEEAIELLEERGHVDAFIEDSTKLKKKQLKAFDLLLRTLLKRKTVNKELALIIRKDGKLEVLKLLEKPDQQMTEDKLKAITEETNLKPENITPGCCIEEEDNTYVLLWQLESD